MMGRIRAWLLMALVVCGFGLVVAGAAPVSAKDPLDEICASQPQATICQRGNNDPLSGENGVILRIARVIATIAGAVAIIVIIIAGIRYVAANGDAQQAAGARKAVLGAAIGLIVIALAAALTTLVLRSIYA